MAKYGHHHILALIKLQYDNIADHFHSQFLVNDRSFGSTTEDLQVPSFFRIAGTHLWLRAGAGATP